MSKIQEIIDAFKKTDETVTEEAPVVAPEGCHVHFHVHEVNEHHHIHTHPEGGGLTSHAHIVP